MNEDHIAIHQFFGYIMIDAPEFTPLYKEYMILEDSEDPLELLERLAQLLHRAYFDSGEADELGARGRNLLNRIINSIERGLAPESAQGLHAEVATAIHVTLKGAALPEPLLDQFGPTLTRAWGELRP